MLQNVVAIVVATVCVLLLARLALPARHRWRLDSTWRRSWMAVRTKVRGAWLRRTARREAARIADEAIRRARRGDVERDGNVLRPKSFKRSDDSREPRKPH